MSMISELADSLEQGGICLITPAEESMRTRSVRFAADMETLVDAGRCPSFYLKNDDNLANTGIHAIQLSLYDFGERVHFYAEDIYSAARKAVEALEGKQDGN